MTPDPAIVRRDVLQVIQRHGCLSLSATAARAGYSRVHVRPVLNDLRTSGAWTPPKGDRMPTPDEAAESTRHSAAALRRAMDDAESAVSADLARLDRQRQRAMDDHAAATRRADEHLRAEVARVDKAAADIRSAYMQTMDRLAGDLARLEGVKE